MKTFKGQVVTSGMQNTIIVAVTRQKVHPVYRRRMKRTKRYKVDTQGGEFSVGDTVTIAQTRPISKDKYFKVVERKKNDSA